jgi:hypothetical protein
MRSGVAKIGSMATSGVTDRMVVKQPGRGRCQAVKDGQNDAE